MTTRASFQSDVRGYDAAGQITEQTYKHRSSPVEHQYYSYDSLQRLTAWGTGTDTAQYSYDRIGNRASQAQTSGGLAANTSYSYNGAGPNHLSQTSLTDAFGNALVRDFGYNADGAVTGITRQSLPLIGPPGTPTLDSLIYSWRGLTRGYYHQVGTFGEYADWRYRYSAGGEREQKRLYIARDSNQMECSGG